MGQGGCQWIVCIGLALALCAGPAQAASNEILIGMNTPVTGANAANGALWTKAVRLAEKQINTAGGVLGKQIKVLVVDDQSTNPGALAAVNKSIEQDKVLALLGPTTSTQILAVSEVIKQAGIPTLVGGSAVAVTRQGNPWLFRVRPDDSIVAQGMVKYIKEDMKLTKVGILHDADAFGSGGADLVEKYAKESGLQVVKREKYAGSDRDFTAQLLALKSAGTEVMVVYATAGPAIAVIQRQYRQIGSPFKFLGSPTSAQENTLNLSKEAAEGLIAMMDNVPGEALRTYAADYKREYGEDMNTFAAFDYDALQILANAIKKGGEDRAKIREAILATKGYVGVLGTYSFTANGDSLHTATVVQIEGGKPKLLKVVTVEPK
ncbi:MAG TPA: ABC transporter substrate-binding protein [Candidatus Baltobacteraceae bacterium]|nr:ABC transporter substrate-binding protein [Candidatus Baltobacteraceae bacterium]